MRKENGCRSQKEGRVLRPVLLVGRANKRRVERFWQVVALLQENSRMTMTEMSKRLNAPVSTLFETLKQVEKLFDFTIVLKGNDKNAPLSGTIPVQSTYQFLIDVDDENAATLKTQAK